MMENRTAVDHIERIVHEGHAACVAAPYVDSGKRFDSEALPEADGI